MLFCLKPDSFKKFFITLFYVKFCGSASMQPKIYLYFLFFPWIITLYPSLYSQEMIFWPLFSLENCKRKYNCRKMTKYTELDFCVLFFYCLFHMSLPPPQGRQPLMKYSTNYLNSKIQNLSFFVVIFSLCLDKVFGEKRPSYFLH